MITEFEEQKHLYYQDIHQQVYSDGHDSRRPQRQYKHVDVSKLFEPHCCTTLINYPSPSPSVTDFLEIHDPDFDSQIDVV